MRLPEENEAHPARTPSCHPHTAPVLGREWKEKELCPATEAGCAVEGKHPSHAEVPGEGGGCV